MPAALLVCFALSAAPPGDVPAARRVMVLDIGHGDDVAKNTAQSVTELVTARASAWSGYKVVSGDDLRAMLELESERQVLGCSDENCLAELAGALDVELVIFGRVSALDDLLIVQLTLYDTAAAQALARSTGKASGKRALADVVPKATDQLLEGGGAAPGPRPLFVTGVTVAGAGALVAVSGALFGVYLEGVLQNAAEARANKDFALGPGQVLTLAMVGAGVVVLGGGIALTFVGSSE